LEISSYQRKENAFQHALEDAQSQFLKLKYAQAEIAERQALAALQQEDPIEEKSIQVLQVQHSQLKEQFEEKSEVLHQTRKELFSLESKFLTLQKQTEEELCSFSEEDAANNCHMQEMLQECQDLRGQVYALEELVSVLILPKKSAAPRKRKNTKEAQEDLFLMIKENMSHST
jgi:hypothetical protein